MTRDYNSVIIWHKGISGENEFYEWAAGNEEAIIHALKLADKLTGEPSEGMSKEGAVSGLEIAANPENINCPLAHMFKAMIAAAQKEVEDGN